MIVGESSAAWVADRTALGWRRGMGSGGDAGRFADFDFEVASLLEIGRHGQGGDEVARALRLERPERFQAGGIEFGRVPLALDSVEEPVARILSRGKESAPIFSRRLGSRS